MPGSAASYKIPHLRAQKFVCMSKKAVEASPGAAESAFYAFDHASITVNAHGVQRLR
jgi:hypothetical protein